jgi:hypothetical protein
MVTTLRIIADLQKIYNIPFLTLVGKVLIFKNNIITIFNKWIVLLDHQQSVKYKSTTTNTS